MGIRRKNFFLQTAAVIFMFLYTLLRLFDISTLTAVVDIAGSEQIPMVGLLACLFFMKLLNKEDIRGLFFGILVFFAFLISNYNGQTNFITIILLTIGLSNQNIIPYVKSIYFATMIGLLGILLMRTIGFIPELTGISPRGNVRYSLGFMSDRGFSDNYFYFCQLFIFLKYENLKKVWLIILLVPMIPLYYYNEARATLILMILMVVMVWISKVNRKNMTPLLYRLANITYLLSLVFTVLTAVLYNSLSKTWVFIDNIFSGRLHLSKFFIDNFPPKLLGQQLPLGLDSGKLWLNYNKNYLMLDSGYMTMLIEAGILIFTIMTIIILITFKKLRDSRENVSLILWIIMGLNLIQTRPLNPTAVQVLQLSKAFGKRTRTYKIVERETFNK
ncbi:hypothetical protein GYN14_04205 [Lactococcus piscium]|uniref:hypothetical protein n=1 Tax=Pseudolactococcus carnosus TaxID=2749961 RepID=UPI001FB8D2C5|nr:hypothetical protein [Lactococcus carnosus]MCJ1991699.1 hypothetical protein [Lactococcus carnosus]